MSKQHWNRSSFVNILLAEDQAHLNDKNEAPDNFDLHVQVRGELVCVDLCDPEFGLKEVFEEESDGHEGIKSTRSVKHVPLRKRK